MCMALPPTEVTGPEPGRENAPESERTRRYANCHFVDIDAYVATKVLQFCLLEEH